MDTIEWPPYSSNLNSQDHNWVYLKRLVYQLRPGLDSITGKDEALDALEECLPEARNSIPQKVMDKLVDSMPRRVAAVIEAQGW